MNNMEKEINSILKESYNSKKYSCISKTNPNKENVMDEKEHLNILNKLQAVEDKIGEILINKVEDDIIKIPVFTDNGEFSHHCFIDKTGQILWNTGKPETSGRYLIVYKQYDSIKPFICDFDEMEDRWINLLEDVEILLWREIPEFMKCVELI